jgi:hypothetical protein
MKTKPTQKEKIVALLSDGRWHSTIELHAICWRYGARLWDLRRDGYVFEKRRTPDPRIEEWRLVSAPDRAGAGRPEADLTPSDHGKPPSPVGSRSRGEVVTASGNARALAPALPQDESGQLSLIGALAGDSRP